MQINGWELFAHPLLLEQVERLITAVESEKARGPKDYQSTANFKVLAALYKLMFESIPVDPTKPEYRQGETLGREYTHWFRAKFGGQRFRLFFRFDSRAKVIVYAWVNDENTLRTYGAKTDAYAVFRKMLGKGTPPNTWDALLKAAKDARARERFTRIRSR